MSIEMIGIDHNRASIDMRAIFSFTKKSAVVAMEQLNQLAGIQGCIILSTCNRMEVWVSTSDEWQGSLVASLCQLKKMNSKEYEEFFVKRIDDEAVEHLLQLTCGLKSQIICEDQIISQVKEALSLARDNYCPDSVLEVLFRTAITAAKKVKTKVLFTRADETAIDRALEMLNDKGVELKDQECMVIGNGEMGKLAAQALQGKGAKVVVTVRQYRSGIVNIPQGCERINYGDRMSHFPKCKLVISATASPNQTITRELLAQVELTQAMYLIDLAVPRDIEVEVGEHQLITLYDIDDFKSEKANTQMVEPLRQAQIILDEKKAEFDNWLSGRDLIPRIQEIKNEAATDLVCRIHKMMAKLAVSDDEKVQLKETIEMATGKVINKMIFGLKDSLTESAFRECVEGLEKLYDES